MGGSPHDHTIEEVQAEGVRLEREFEFADDVCHELVEVGIVRWLVNGFEGDRPTLHAFEHLAVIATEWRRPTFGLLSMHLARGVYVRAAEAAAA